MISIIAAMAQNRTLGNNGEIPWHISEDLIRGKNLTMGHPIIMGRKTHESIAGFKNHKGWEHGEKPKLRPLPGRTNIVLTSQKEFKSPGSIVVNSIDEAVEVAEESEGNEEIFIFGGAGIYEQFFERADRIYLTVIQEEVEGDVFFPHINEKDWKVVKNNLRICRVLDKEIRYRFITYDRK